MPHLMLVLAGLMGAAGIALTAAAAHGKPGMGLDNAGYLLVIHAAALLGGVAALQAGLLARGIGLVALMALMLGAAVFAGDLAMRAYFGHRLFPMAAPTGGTVMILGWLMVTVAAGMAMLSSR